MPRDILCYFCGETREQAVEHFFSKSSRKQFPIDNNDRGEYYTDGSFEKQDPGAVGTSPARDICKVCNTGWMSIIQKKAKPWIETWMLGYRRIFDDEAIEIITTWAVMTSMTIDSFDPRYICVPIEERRKFAADQIVSDRWHIWGGTLDGDLDRGWRHAPMSADGIRYGQTTVMLNGVSVYVMCYSPYPFPKYDCSEFGIYSLRPTFDARINAGPRRVPLPMIRDLPELISNAPINPLRWRDPSERGSRGRSEG